MTADLHIHTTASDGRLAPEEIIKTALSAGLSEIAITDHDTVAGLLQLYADKAVIKGQLTIIPGIEFSTEFPCHEVHILGYNIDIFHTALKEELGKLSYDRQQRVQKMVAKLKKLGYVIEYQQVLALAGNAGSIGRPHVARALLENGYFTEIGEVFTALLGKNGPAYVPHYKMNIKTVLQVIKSVGGTAVLAHPGLIDNDDIVFEVINVGIDGLEVYHPMHTSWQANKYLEMAQKYNLLVTGGSDFHGMPGRYPEKLGDFTISSALAKKICRIQG
ncbi:MAG: PHP domain-containing protein [Pelosinus sp.]|nr:PHP domain-containing protein [Pelosinus sp.]